MALVPKEKNIEIKNKLQKERRNLLKKAAYNTPGLIVLGQLVQPTNLIADSREAVNNDRNLGTPEDFWNN